jgi:hypothetical protein
MLVVLVEQVVLVLRLMRLHIVLVLVAVLEEVQK